MASQERQPFKVGLVGIIGKPNVGKSTLVNDLLGFKLSAVTHKPQTTRHKIIGILSGDHYQIVLLDTPGVLKKPRYELHRAMIQKAMEALREADLLLFVVEPYPPQEEDLLILEEIKREKKKAILVINKIDRIRKLELLPLMDYWSKQYDFLEIIPISALRFQGIDDLLKAVIQHLPEGEPLYPPDMLSVHPERFFAAEIIREKVFQHYGQEIPYSTAVVIDEWVEQDPEHKGKDYIRALIFVERDSQKGILIGKGGEALKKIGTLARKEIEAMIGRPVYLEIWVKVRPKWRQDPRFLRQMGL